MKHSISVPIGVRIAFLTLLTVQIATSPRLSSQESKNQKLLWQIGTADRGNSEFALAPKYNGQFSDDGFFIVSRSDTKTSWPYVHPGPADQWAGSRQHVFTILFATKGSVKQGTCVLKFHLLDTHSQVPPRLLIQINGRNFSETLPKGGGDESINGKPDRGKPYQFDIDFPVDLLRIGDNEITIANVAGSWFLYDWLGLETPTGINLSQVSTRTTFSSGKSLPFLTEKDGISFQPMRLEIKHTGDSTAAQIGLAGAELTSFMLETGIHEIELAVSAVASETLLSFQMRVAGKVVDTLHIVAKPVRKMVVYVLPHSHTDIGYTEIQTAIEEKQMNNLSTGIDYARKTAEYPEGSRFVWNVEVLWAADLYLHRMSEDQRIEFFNAVKKGWVALNGMYLNELTGLCRPEELLELFRYSTQLAEKCGTTVDAAMISDVPGYTWGTVTAMAQAGIKYFSTAPNYFDRIGDILVQWENKPFYWTSPSGKEKVLVWIPYKGYAMSHGVNRMSPRFVEEYMAQVERSQYPYDIIYMRWSGHGDNAVPEIEVSEFVKEWNSKYVSPRFVISSTSDAFRAFEKRYGGRLPVVRGDWTPYWEDGAGSSALETAMNRESSDRLVQAQTLWAMLNPTAVPATIFEDAWRYVLLYSEHTWGAWCSVSDPENSMTKEQWEIKRSYALKADSLSRELLARARKEPSSKSLPSKIDVFNTNSWSRTELVVLAKDVAKSGDRVTDEKGRPVPSQRLVSGELAFLASDVPPFSSRRYSISKGKPFSATMATVKGSTLDNQFIRLTVDGKTGAIADFRFKGIDRNLVDTASGHAVNDYLYLPGDSLVNLERNGPATVKMNERGPLVASLLITSEAPGCNKLTREVRLTAGFDYAEIINIVDKKRAAISLEPGSWQFAQKGGKESVNFAFPFNVTDGIVRLDIPLGEMRPEIDQMLSACKNWFSVGRWADVSNDKEGITWVTLDAPLVQIGGITATLVGSQANPTVWRKHVEPTQKLYSWAMNNHWGTNYRAYQDGPIVFRYAIRPHQQFSSSEATRFAVGLSQPLMARPASGDVLSTSLLRIEPEGVTVISLRSIDDGRALLIKLFGASGKTEKARLEWANPRPRSLWRSNTSEKPLELINGEIEVPGWDVVTLRAEFK